MTPWTTPFADALHGGRSRRRFYRADRNGNFGELRDDGGADALADDARADARADDAAPTMTATTPSRDDASWRATPAPPPIILIIVAIAVLVIVIVVACAAFKLGRATAKVNPLPDSQVVPVRPTQVAQMPACVELVPIGVVKTSVLVTQQDNNGNNIVHEQAVAADHALGQATLPQGVISRRS